MNDYLTPNLGGRGKCKYCKEWHNNVAYHSEVVCDKNPNIVKSKDPPMKILNYNESYGNCEECNKHDELRPYGIGGKWICFDCGMKDEENTIKSFEKLLNSDSTVVIKT